MSQSPIEKAPRRQAGQTLSERLFVDFGGYVFFACGVTATSLVLVTVTWVYWVALPSQTPWAVSLAAVVCVVLVGIRGWSRYQRAKRDGLGLRGELETAEWLNELGLDGYRIFHDLQGPRGNIDHVAVGPAGVFVVETKTRSKRRGDRVRYDGRRLFVGEWDATDEHLAQARACRDEVRRRLRVHSDMTADVPVRAVLVYPGWDVEECSGAEVWVLNPRKRVAAWIRQEQRRQRLPSAERLELVFTMFDSWARERV